MITAVFLYEKLDKVLAICGSVLGTSVVLFLPSVSHYLLIGKSHKGTPWTRRIDLGIAVYAIIVLVGVTTQEILGWL